MFKNERIKKLITTAEKQGVDCILIVPGANLCYLTELWMGMSERVTAIAFPRDKEPFAVCPALESGRIAAGTGIQTMYTYEDGEGPVGAFSKALSQHAVTTFGVEYESMRLLERETIVKTKGDYTFVDIGPILAQLRSIKDDEERLLIQKACVIADTAMQAGIQAVRPGIKETAVMHEVERVIREHGAEGGLAVASGARTTLPHAHSSEKIIQDGDVVWLDIVVTYKSYCADITRTCFVGAPDLRLREVFNIVLEAQRIGRSQACAGMTGADIDALGRDHITQAGYGEYFIHRTGHGIGLSVHEEPYIVKSNKEKIQPGMTFTIEPGIYLPSTGGVRIEDTVVMAETDVESMTRSERNLLDVPVDR
jgi:Xaa-Pro aminopeptidase